VPVKGRYGGKRPRSSAVVLQMRRGERWVRVGRTRLTDANRFLTKLELRLPRGRRQVWLRPAIPGVVRGAAVAVGAR